MRYPVSLWWQGKEEAPCLGFFHCLLFLSCWEMLASSRYTLLGLLPLCVAIPATGLQVHRLSSIYSNWDVPPTFQTKIFSCLPDPLGGHEGSQTQHAQDYSVLLDFVSLLSWLRGSPLLRIEGRPAFLTPWSPGLIRSAPKFASPGWVSSSHSDWALSLPLVLLHLPFQKWHPSKGGPDVSLPALSPGSMRLRMTAMV